MLNLLILTTSFSFSNRNLIKSFIGLGKRKEIKSMITTKVNIIASVVLEIKNNHLFPLSPLNPHQMKRLTIAIELQQFNLNTANNNR